MKSWRCSLHSWFLSYTFMPSSCVLKFSLFFFFLCLKTKNPEDIALFCTCFHWNRDEVSRNEPLYYLCCCFFVPLDRLFFLFLLHPITYYLFTIYLFLFMTNERNSSSPTSISFQADTHDITKKSLHEFNTSSGSNTDIQLIHTDTTKVNNTDNQIHWTNEPPTN